MGQVGRDDLQLALGGQVEVGMPVGAVCLGSTRCGVCLIVTQQVVRVEQAIPGAGGALAIFRPPGVRAIQVVAGDDKAVDDSIIAENVAGINAALPGQFCANQRGSC